MIFYHVSTAIQKNGVFRPRIPKDRFDDENDTIQRISVAPTLAAKAVHSTA